MILVDTHAHLYLNEFSADLDQVIESAKANDVKYLLLPNIDSSTIPAMNQVVSMHPEICFPMIGLHPTSVKENYKNELAIVHHYVEQGGYLAIGEIGIDLYWDKSFEKEQLYTFRYQVELAKEYHLPLAIHTRSSMDVTLDLIEELNDGSLSGVFHCFSGTYEEAVRIIDNGFKLGIGGVITFKNSGLDKVIEHIALEDLLLETDSPYLTPSPNRGLRNECAYILNIAQKVAEVKKTTLEHVAEVTTENALKIFQFVNSVSGK